MRHLSLVLCGLVMTAAALAEDTPAQAAFNRFKKLEGNWVGKMGDQEIHWKYQVIADGSAVIETIGDVCKDQMVTVYYLDGKDLVLTHYCCMHNQPHMKGEVGKDGKEVNFTCVAGGGGNLPDEKAPHMHKAKYTFADDDHITAAWTLSQDGKDAGVHEFSLARAK